MFLQHSKMALPLIILLLISACSAYPFVDVSVSAGMRRNRGPRTKYGGAVVADLDGDGWPDLLIGHHDQFTADMYFNNRNGTFTRAQWKFWDDTHSFTPFHATPRSRTLRFYASTGGNYGKNPSSPRLFGTRFDSNRRKFVTLGNAGFAKGRGRAVVPISLTHVRKAQYWTNFMFMNALPARVNGNVQPRQYYAGALVGRAGLETQERKLQGFRNIRNGFGTAIDVDGDGEMELITWHKLRVHRITGFYTLRDITSGVLPPHVRRAEGVVAVSEFDYDNDGHMDLYIARSVTNDLKWLVSVIGKNPNDYLLRNIGGRYVDVSHAAGIPQGGESRGVTAADFNNDGFIDLLVTQFTGPDRLLLNKGDGTFGRVSQGYWKNPTTRGDHPTAVDYDRDGWPDVILSEGDYHKRNHGGFMRVMRNVIAEEKVALSTRTWLLVRVGASVSGMASSMHAVVRVRAGTLRMMRRVGSPGTATGVSYIETVHFGLRNFTGVARVSVTWRDGSSRTVVARPNSVAKVGLF